MAPPRLFGFIIAHEKWLVKWFFEKKLCEYSMDKAYIYSSALSGNFTLTLHESHTMSAAGMPSNISSHVL